MAGIDGFGDAAPNEDFIRLQSCPLPHSFRHENPGHRLWPTATRPKGSDCECEKLLKVAWDPPAAERLVIDLLPAVRKSINAERAAGTPLSEAVRTRRFAERVRQEVLGETTR
jgi:hypothetical protein